MGLAGFEPLDLSDAIVRNNALVAVEKLSMRQLHQSPIRGRDGRPSEGKRRDVNEKLLDAAPARLIEMIRYKAERAGGAMVEVDPKMTTQECSACGAIVWKRRRSDHVCGCGAELHRDVNAARNILERGLAARAAATGRGTSASSSKAARWSRNAKPRSD